MAIKGAGPLDPADLRRRAEELLRKKPADLAATPPEEAGRLLHELQVHQIELEMQNYELRRAQEEIERSRVKYLDLYDWAPMGYFTVSEKGLILEANYRAAELLGVERNRLVKQSLTRYIVSEDQEIYYLHHKHLLETGALKVCELRMCSPDGSPFWARLVMDAALDGETGRVVSRVILSDITERKRAEEVLRESEQKYRVLVANANEAIFIAQDETVKFPNPKALEMIGYSTEELGSVPFIDLIHPEDRGMVLERYFNRLQGGTPTEAYPFRIMKKTGEEIWVQLTPKLIDWDERPGVLCLLRDITKERNLEAQLMQAQKMEAVGTNAGGIAHDFNNMLSVIIVYGEMLKRRIANDPMAVSYLDEILRSAERASVLTRQLLTFARRQIIELGNLDLNRVIADLEKLLRKVTRENIEIKTSLAEGLSTIRADQGQVEQVLMNLSLNARDAMPGGGQLVVETEEAWVDEEYVKQYLYMKAGRYVLLSVSDTGSGMDEETRERIFEPFFTTKGPDKGTGLGLAVVYGIVKQHNGFIHVYSEPGKGTTFHIYFPAVDVPPDSKDVVARGIIRGGSETILLAEDNESVRHLAEQTLINYGYRVLTACDGEEAVDIFRQDGKEIAIVVLDMVMPNKGGKQAYDEMIATIPGLKAIFMSGYSANAIHDSFVLHPGIPFLQKPFGPSDLARKVREVLERSEIGCS